MTDVHVMSLSELMGAGSRSQQPPEPTNPARDVQTLRNVFEALNEGGGVSHFEPGDIMRHKFPSTSVVSVAKHPALFLGYLDAPVMGLDYVRDPDQLAQFQAALCWDCRIMLMVGGHAMTYLANSLEYEPHPEYTPQPVALDEPQPD